MDQKHLWMPVFIVTASRTVYEPQDEMDPTVHPRKHDEDLLRVGTAHRRDDGAYLIALAALPVDGQLLMRAPREGDTVSLTGGRA